MPSYLILLSGEVYLWGILTAGNGPHLMGFCGTLSISCLLWHAQAAGSIPPAYAWSNTGLSKIPLQRDVHCCVVQKWLHTKGIGFIRTDLCVCTLLNHSRTTCVRVTFKIKRTIEQESTRLFWTDISQMMMRMFQRVFIVRFTAKKSLLFCD